MGSRVAARDPARRAGGRVAKPSRLERAIGYVYAASPMFVYLDAQYLALSQPPNLAE